MAHDAFGRGGTLRAMFHPTTVAVLGAADEPGTLGYKTFARLATGGFEGSLVAVDPRERPNEFGIRVYRELEDVPAPIDLVVVVTASNQTLDAIEKCVRARVKAWWSCLIWTEPWSIAASSSTKSPSGCGEVIRN
jgi:acetyltransferase